MNKYKASLKDPALAKALLDLTEKFEQDLLEMRQIWKEKESSEDFDKSTMAVGYILAMLGSSIYFPMYRLHPEFTPELLKDCLEKEQRRHAKDVPDE